MQEGESLFSGKGPRTDFARSGRSVQDHEAHGLYPMAPDRENSGEVSAFLHALSQCGRRKDRESGNEGPEG